MKEVDFNSILPILNEKLADGGVFLTTLGDKPNTMTIGWALMGTAWGKNLFVAWVRSQRYTHEIIEKAGEFTVSVPTKNPLRKELVFAGTKSGRDVNKFEGHGLTALAGQETETPVVAECGIHIECKIVHEQDMTGDNMSEDVAKRMYPMNDYHDMYFGEVVKCYTTDE